MWALEAKKPIQNIKTIIESLSKAEKDAKDERKLSAVHYFCKYGMSEFLAKDEKEATAKEMIELFLENKAKFAPFAGYNKYTPFNYACVYGHFEIAK